MPTDWRVAFNNGVSIAWNAWLSWSCAGSGGGAGSHSGGGTGVVDGLPCNQPATVVDALHLGDAVRQLAAMEKLLAAWGVQVRRAGRPCGWQQWLRSGRAESVPPCPAQTSP